MENIKDSSISVLSCGQLVRFLLFREFLTDEEVVKGLIHHVFIRRLGSVKYGFCIPKRSSKNLLNPLRSDKTKGHGRCGKATHRLSRTFNGKRAKRRTKHKYERSENGNNLEIGVGASSSSSLWFGSEDLEEETAMGGEEGSKDHEVIELFTFLCG